MTPAALAGAAPTVGAAGLVAAACAAPAAGPAPAAGAAPAAAGAAKLMEAVGLAAAAGAGLALAWLDAGVAPIDIMDAVTLKDPIDGRTSPCAAMLATLARSAACVVAELSVAATTTIMDPAKTSTHAAGAMAAEHSSRNNVLFATTVA